MQQLTLFSNYPTARPTRLGVRVRKRQEVQHLDLWSQEGTAEKEMALFFLDIRNFTRFVERHRATDVVHVIRKVFSQFQHIIRVYHGRIIETTGDGLYAAFGFNSSVTEGVNAAVEAGFAILKALENLNKSSFEKNLQQRMEVGIGVHVGKVATGSLQLGSKSHFIVMGQAVNIASRLQAATKELNNNFIVSSRVYNMLSSRQESEAVKISLKGVSDPLEVHFVGRAYDTKVA